MIDIQIMSFKQVLRITDYDGLYHLLLRLHVASISNEITLVGDHKQSSIYIVNGYHARTPTSKQLLTIN